MTSASEDPRMRRRSAAPARSAAAAPGTDAARIEAPTHAVPVGPGRAPAPSGQSRAPRRARASTGDEHHDRSDRLLAAALAVVSARDLDELLRETAARAADIVGAHHATVGLAVDREWAQQIMTTHLSPAFAGVRPHVFRAAHAALADEVCRTNRPLRMAPEEADRVAAPPVGETLGEPPPTGPARGFLGVPLVGHEGRNLGLIHVSNRTDGAFDEADEQLLASLAQFTAMAIEQLRLQADLSYQSRLTRTVAENATSGLVLLDPAGEVTYMNSAARRIIGYERRDLVGRTLHSIVHHSRRDGSPLPMAECRIWQTVSGEATPNTPFEDTFIRRDGSFFPVRLTTAPIHREGRVTGVVLEVQDISAEHAVQSRLRDLALSASDRAAKLRGLIESIGDAVIVCEPDGQVSLVNPAAVTLFGVRLEHARDLAAYLRSEDGDPVTSDGPLRGSFLMPGRGHETWIEARSFPVPSSTLAHRPEGAADLDNGGHGWICVLRDVSRARQAKLLRETFIGMLSHELRTPITTVYGGAKVLARRPDDLPADIRSIVLDIESESERLYRLVEDLVVLTKSESASLETSREPVLLHRLVPHVVATEARRWPTVSFRIDDRSKVPAVLAEQTYIEQVVRNLLTNAAKYGGSSGPVDVEIGAEGGHALVRVLDRGPGFPPEDAERLFDIYYRSPAVVHRTAGAGIGLFVSKALVEAMDGRIWARARAGGGAEFGFALPLLAEALDEDDGP